MKKAHFIGICGVGMSATAILLKECGFEISGSDSECYEPVKSYLAKQGITLKEGYKKDNIPKGTDLIVIGKNAKLVPEENEEVAYAFRSGVTVRSFPEVLRGLTEKKHNIIVAGSYGKSTCAGLLAWCLIYAGKDPSYFIGAWPYNMEATSHIGTSEIFIIEGDEYPTSNWDETSKFLYYNAHDVLFTSAELDHINIFPTQEEYLVPFITLLSLLPKDGHRIINADEPQASNLASQFPKTATYGLSKEALWHAENISYADITTFDLLLHKKKIVTIKTTLLGKHNIQNIVGSAAMLLEKELVTPDELRQGIASFKGIRRRLDQKTKNSTVRVYEGFGSSYDKARAGISAMKLHFPNKRLVIVFEPHTFSWRNKDTAGWYDTVFNDCDRVLVYEPALQGALTHLQLSQQDIVERIKKTGINVSPIKNKEDALSLLERELLEDDIVLFMTSGDLGGLIEEIPKFVEKKFPK